MTIDLRSETQCKKAERDEKICSQYIAIRNQQPMATDNQIFNYLSKLHRLTNPAIRNILTKNRLYIPKRQRS